VPRPLEVEGPRNSRRSEGRSPERGFFAVPSWQLALHGLTLVGFEVGRTASQECGTDCGVPGRCHEVEHAAAVVTSAEDGVAEEPVSLGCQV